MAEDNILNDGTFLLTTNDTRRVNGLVKKAGLKSYLFGVDSRLLVTFGFRRELEKLTDLFRAAGILDDYNFVEDHYPPAFIDCKDESGLGDYVARIWLKNHLFHFSSIDDYIEEHNLIFDEKIIGGDPAEPDGAGYFFRGDKKAIDAFIQFCLAEKCLAVYRVDHKKWKPEDKGIRIKRYLQQILFRDDIRESAKNRLKEREYWKKKNLAGNGLVFGGKVKD